MEKSRKNANKFCLKEEERINTVLEELNERGKIDEKFLKSIKSVGEQLPKLSGLAKVHKENIPVRPVLSIPGSPYYKLAEKITDWLSVIPESKINCSKAFSWTMMKLLFLLTLHHYILMSLLKKQFLKQQRNCTPENLPCHQWTKKPLLFLRS